MSWQLDMKIVLLGKAFGGKTSLVDRYIHDWFQGDIPAMGTIGAAFSVKILQIGDTSVKLNIWDTAGSERYEAMSKMYYRDAQAAIICYDLTDRTSFDKVRFWATELKVNEENCKIYLCGTKKDLTEEKNKRVIDKKMTTDYAEEIAAAVFETSSKTGENIRELFHQIVQDFANDPSTYIPRDKDILKVQATRKKSSCCRQ